MEVLQSDTVKLSGRGFFFVTKGLILSVLRFMFLHLKFSDKRLFQMAGTILTYEIVLVQQYEYISSKNNVSTTSCGDILI